MKEKIAGVIDLLEKAYPERKTALNFSSPFQLLVATILSSQTTDTRVNRVTAVLFQKYPGPEELAKIPEGRLAADIKSVNFYRTKAHHIKKLCQTIVSRYHGLVPDRMESLVTLPGVARKTANVVLSQAFGKAEGIVVDTHVRRLTQRIGLTRQDNPEKIELDLMKLVPKDKWISFPFSLILHGRKVCKAQGPDCPNCVINGLCDYYPGKNE